MISPNLIKDLEALLGAENVFTSEADCASYSYDGAVLPSKAPGLVVRPTQTEQLGDIIRLCYEAGVAITVRGAGSNLSGGTVPDTENSVVILTNSLNRILEINTEDLYAVVEPGVVTAQFAAAVEAKGLFYPPDPGSMSVSTIAGNIAENAGGLRGLKYGVTKDYVMGLEFYDYKGNLVKTGSRTVKCVTGFNLAGLMVASEGCMGVISKAILKLVPPPKASKALTAEFANVQDAGNAVAGIIAAHVLPCTLELLDQNTLKVVEADQKCGLPVNAAAMLLIEVDGHPAQVADDAARVEEVLRKCGATAVHVPGSAEEKNKLWTARRMALPALARARPTCVLEDATVPRSQIPAMLAKLDEIAKKYNLMMGTFGHAGDGNLHIYACKDELTDEAWNEVVEKVMDELYEAAKEMGGEVSGEHGIGHAKKGFLAESMGETQMNLMRGIKAAFDPKGILNPGKVVG